MNSKRFFIGLGAALLSAFILFKVIGGAGESTDRSLDGVNQSVAPSERKLLRASDRGAQSPRAVRSEVGGNLGTQYDALCQCWLEFVELGEDGGLSDEAVATRVALARRSVEILRLSRQLMELDNFLRTNGILINRNGASILTFAHQLIRENPEDVGKYRDSFLELCRSLGPEMSQNETLGSLAGTLSKQGDDEEFMLFFEKLEAVNQGLGNEAFASRSLAVVQTDPDSLYDAVSGMLEHFDSGNDQLDRKLENMIQWAGANGAYDKVLNELSNSSDDARFKAARGASVLGIASQDPIKAIDLISGAPGKFHPGVAGWRGGTRLESLGEPARGREGS